MIHCARRGQGVARFLKKIAPKAFWHIGLGSTYEIEQTTFALLALPFLIRKRFDIIHLQDPRLALILERTRVFHGAQVIFSHGTEEPFEFLANFKYVQELMPHYLEADRAHGLSKEKTWFSIPNFVDCARFSAVGKVEARKKLNISEKSFVVVASAALKFVHKRLDHLMREIAKVRKKHPEVFLVMVGATTDETPELEKLACDVLGDNVRIIRDAAKEDMPDIYRAADIFVHTALFEMFAIAVVEALASGLPVVAHKNSTFELIVGPAGQLVSMDNAGDLAVAVENFITNKDLCAKKASLARKRAVEDFEASKIVCQTITMYEEVLTKRKEQKRDMKKAFAVKNFPNGEFFDRKDKHQKVAILSSGLGHISRGIEAWADDLTGELNRQGVHVLLLKGGGVAERPFEKVIHCARRDYGVARFLKKISPKFAWHFGFGSTYTIEQTTFALLALPFLAMKRFDIIHLKDPWLALILERTRALHGARVILGHATEEPFEFLINFKHVQELTPHYLEADRARGLSKEKRWFAIPNFVDCACFTPSGRTEARKKLNIPEKSFVVLSVAALKMAHKRLDYLTREIAKVREKHPETFLVIAGAVTGETAELEKFAYDMLGDHVRIISNIKTENMPDIYRAADIFVHAALFEMFGTAILEALASGLPVIAHKNPTFEWIVGHAGQLISMENTGSLAAAAEGFLANKDLSTKIASYARNQALENFEISKIVGQIIAMYKEVLGE